ncbi:MULTISPECIES: TerB family tellurite resistance protein [unclassified Leptolyngbya]|uniref:tellurite resistance TerB family protein n=1 Tax=unclassified Leptolyngbya TaxID=2650499 RepID=UPI0016820FB4|nr:MULTISPECIES: TerB family tellurite resistance protein [unclassified Leptolyngbya]MBD1910506.1 TerB family tellurite resistance protein [Leptolyngbya sp. FACHB-8]MBD2153673.1 TerB family tellurite resistance protein [Leptolyngbya sp. FACHB-16]
MTPSLMDSLPLNVTPQILLSHLTEQPLSEEDSTLNLIFVAASVTLMSGVMMMDGVIDPEEMVHLHQLMGVCADTDTACHRLLPRLILGIKRHQIYLNPRLFLVLAEALDLPQRLLLLGLGYRMAAADGHLNERENLYLRAIAQRLCIDPQHVAILEANSLKFTLLETEALWEVNHYLDPSNFQLHESLLRLIARTIHSNLPAIAIPTAINA